MIDYYSAEVRGLRGPGLEPADKAKLDGLDAALAGKATVAQGAKADSAVQPDALATAIATRATAAQGTKADSAVQPDALATALATRATAAQGTKADSAVQPDALATAIATRATAAQGTKADSAVQPDALAIAIATRATSAQGEKADSAVQPTALIDATQPLADAIAPVTAYLANRSGDARSLFSQALTGEPSVRAPIAIGTVSTTAAGKVLRITGADTDDATGYADVAMRAAYPVYPGRTYRVTYVLQRMVDPTDPENNAVELRWQNLNSGKANVSNIRLGASVAPAVAEGAVTYSFLIGKAGALGELAYTIPPTAIYGLPLQRVFGNGQETGIVDMRIEDVTDSVAIDAKTDDIRDDLTSESGRAAAAETALDNGKFDKTGGLFSGPVDHADHDVTISVPEPAARASAWAFPIVGADGRRAGLRKDGTWVGKRLRGLPAQPGRASRHAIPFEDALGRVVASILRSGRFWGRGMDIVPEPEAKDRARRYRFGITTTAFNGYSRLLLGFDSLGKVIARLSAQSLEHLTDDLSARVTGWRGTDHVANVRVGSIVMRGLMTDGDGVAYDALQTRNGFRLNSAIADGSGIDLIIRVGQSNAGGGSGATGVAGLRAIRYPRHVLGAADGSGGPWVDWYGNSEGEGGAAPIYRNIDFAPAYHALVGASPTICAANAVVALARAAKRRVNPQVCITSWRGGTGATDFEPGDPFHLYENAIEATKRARQAGGWYGLPVSAARIVWTQGENGPFTGYAALFGTLIESYRSGVQAAAGLPALPGFYFNQINQAADDVATGVELDQRQVAIDRVGTGVTCVGPMYQFPLLEQDGVNIHTSDLGRSMQGELEALVFATPGFIAVGQNVSIVRAGAVITLTYANLPADGQLRVDGDWVAAVPALGFKVSRQSNGSAVAINSAVVSGANQIVLTLANDPGGAVRVDYARDTDNPQALWAGGRGLIYVDSGTLSPLAGANGAPPTIRHYALRMRVITAA